MEAAAGRVADKIILRPHKTEVDDRIFGEAARFGGRIDGDGAVIEPGQAGDAPQGSFAGEGVEQGRQHRLAVADGDIIDQAAAEDQIGNQ